MLFSYGFIFFTVSSHFLGFYKSKLEIQIPHMEPADPQLGKQQNWNFCILSTVQRVRGETLAELLILIRCYPQMVFAFAYLQTRLVHSTGKQWYIFLSLKRYSSNKCTPLSVTPASFPQVWSIL